MAVRVNALIAQHPTQAPTASFGAGFAWAFRRDIMLAWRHPGETMLVVAFFVLVASLFPLGVGAEPQLLARIGGTLLALLALPLFVPILVFGAGAAEAQATGLSPSPHLSILGAGLILAVFALPSAVCAALRIALD